MHLFQDLAGNGAAVLGGNEEGGGNRQNVTRTLWFVHSVTHRRRALQ